VHPVAQNQTMLCPMNGWVIVYMPGGPFVYDMFDDSPGKKTSFRKRLVRSGVKTFLAVAQLYWWLKA
jgi:hypothetical protein